MHVLVCYLTALKLDFPYKKGDDPWLGVFFLKENGVYLVFWQDKTKGASDINRDKQQCPEMSHFYKPKLLLLWNKDMLYLILNQQHADCTPNLSVV